MLNLTFTDNGAQLEAALEAFLIDLGEIAGTASAVRSARLVRPRGHHLHARRRSTPNEGWTKRRRAELGDGRRKHEQAAISSALAALARLGQTAGFEVEPGFIN